MLPLESSSFILYTSSPPWIVPQHFASANTLTPLSSTHKRALKLTLLKSRTLRAHDYKSVDVLPLKSRLEYNKDVRCAPSTLKPTFLPIKIDIHITHVIRLPRIDLFKCSLVYSGGTLWNNLPLSIKTTTKHSKAFTENTSWIKHN